MTGHYDLHMTRGTSRGCKDRIGRAGVRRLLHGSWIVPKAAEKQKMVRMKSLMSPPSIVGRELSTVTLIVTSSLLAVFLRHQVYILA